MATVYRHEGHPYAESLHHASTAVTGNAERHALSSRWSPEELVHDAFQAGLKCGATIALLIIGFVLTASFVFRAIWGWPS